MRIIRHTARDMRQAMRAVREQLGDDAVILSSKRTSAGIEVTAAVDFDAATLESGGFANDTDIAATASMPVPAAPNPSALAHTARRPVRHDSVQPVSAAPPVTAAPVATVAAQPSAQPPPPVFAPPQNSAPPMAGWDSEWISPAARDAVIEHAQTIVQSSVASVPAAAPQARVVESAPVLQPTRADRKNTSVAATNTSRTEIPVFRGQRDPVEEIHAASQAPLAAAPTSLQAPPALTPSVTDEMGSELKTLRRMLETQLAHLAWNDLTRRAPIHTEMLRELSEIGITPDLAEVLVRQLPDDTDLTFARRFTIAGLSQYLRVTGDTWLDDGGRIALVGAAGVGKTTTLAKLAVRWVLRHGPEQIALVAADTVRIGAQDQLKSLGQLLGVPVYSADRFGNLPSLLQRLDERLILIDTPGAHARDPHLSERLEVLGDPAAALQTALVLSASTQAGALEESVKHYGAANPACCILTKIDEAASLGGVLSVLIRAKLPVSYISEGQRVPEDLRPARALELVSSAVRLAKAHGAVADEDLLRRRFGKTAHGFT